MGEVYKKAKQVIVWLGEGNADSARALKYLSEFGSIDKVGKRRHEALLEKRIKQWLKGIYTITRSA